LTKRHGCGKLVVVEGEVPHQVFGKGDRKVATKKTRKLDEATLAERPYFRFELVGPSAKPGDKLSGKGDVVLVAGKVFRNRANVRESGRRWKELHQVLAGLVVVTKYDRVNSKTRVVEEVL
jgi:hypothetical protein